MYPSFLKNKYTKTTPQYLVLRCYYFILGFVIGRCCFLAHSCETAVSFLANELKNEQLST
jgi:hypothetical protein